MIVNIKDLIMLNCRERAAQLVASMYMHDKSAINGKEQHVDTHILKETTKNNPYCALAQEDSLTQEEFSRDCEYSKKIHIETSKENLDAMVLEYMKKDDRFWHDLALYYKSIVNKQGKDDLTGRLRVAHELDNQDMYVQVYRDGQASVREKACGVTIIFDIDAAGRVFIFTAFPNVDRESCVNSTTIGRQSGYIKGQNKKLTGADCPANLEAFEATADGSPTKDVTYSFDGDGNYYIKSSNIARAASFNSAQGRVEMRPISHGEDAKRVVINRRDALTYVLYKLGEEFEVTGMHSRRKEEGYKREERALLSFKEHAHAFQALHKPFLYEGARTDIYYNHSLTKMFDIHRGVTQEESLSQDRRPLNLDLYSNDSFQGNVRSVAKPKAP